MSTGEEAEVETGRVASPATSESDAGEGQNPVAAGPSDLPAQRDDAHDAPGDASATKPPEQSDDSAAVSDAYTGIGTTIAALKREGQQHYDRLLRSAADYQNLKRRSSRERTQAVQRAEEKLALSLLPVVDNMERALAHGDQGAANADKDGLLDGVRLVHKQFLDALARHEIAPFESVGQPFNPELHDAVQQQHSDEPRGTILHEAQRGYRRDTRLVRPAMVVVSLGPLTDAATGGTVAESDDSGVEAAEDV